LLHYKMQSKSKNVSSSKEKCELTLKIYKRNFSSVPYKTSGHMKLSSTTPLSLSRDINIVLREEDAKFWLFESNDFGTRDTIFCLRYFTLPVIFEKRFLEAFRSICATYTIYRKKNFFIFMQRFSLTLRDHLHIQ